MQARKIIDPLAKNSRAWTWHLPDVSVTEARARLRQALNSEGFSILSEIDLGDLVNRRLDAHTEPHLVTEVCHASLTLRGLTVAADASLLSPFHVSVWREGRGTSVAVLPPRQLADVLGRPHLEEVAGEMTERLERVLGLLDRPAPSAPAEPPQASVTIDGKTLAVLREAASRQLRALEIEAAGTDSRPMQHELAQMIDRLENALRALGEPTP